MVERITRLDEIEDAEKFLAAHYKALEDLKALRAEAKAYETELETLREAGSDENLEKWKQRALKQAAKAALEGEGIKNADRVLKYIDLDGVDFDENESLTGLDDKLGEVKGDFPELFDSKRRAGRQSVDIHAKGDAPKVDPFRDAIHQSLARQ